MFGLWHIGYFFLMVLRNIRQNLMIHLITTGSIAFSLLILGAVLCIFLNVDDLVKKWRKEVSIVLFLEDNLNPSKIEDLKTEISEMLEVDNILYVPKEEALKRLKTQLKNQDGILEGLETNPLPASFEIRLKPRFQNIQSIRTLVQRLKGLSAIDEVQYGEAWIERLTTGFRLIKLVALVIFGLLFMSTVFIISNTIKLAIYARREELEIMRLVGATNLFIKTPFYIEALLQGLVGAVLAVAILFGIYRLFVSKVQMGSLSISFLPSDVILGIVGAGIGLGLFGSLISFRRFIRI